MDEQRVVGDGFLRELIAVAQQLNLAGGGQHAFGQQAFAQHGVEKGGLAGVELADDHEQEKLIQLVERLLEQSQIFFGRVEADQQQAQVFEQAALVAQQLVLFAG